MLVSLPLGGVELGMIFKFFSTFFQLRIYYFYNHMHQKLLHIIKKTCCRDEMSVNILLLKCITVSCGHEYG